jgi:hypothetical protein
MAKAHLALLAALMGLWPWARAFGGETGALYQNAFAKAEVGKVPEGMLVLDGAFAVGEADGNRFLELPGAPLESFGVLFGPTEKENIAVSARIFGTRKGRRYPTFAVGLNGVGGYRLQVSPGKKELELYRGDEDQASAAFAWTADEWTHLKLRVRKTGQGGWKVEGKAWREGKPEPAAWAIAIDEKEEPKPGRAGVFGSPFAETPIRFDDLVVERVPD